MKVGLFKFYVNLPLLNKLTSMKLAKITLIGAMILTLSSCSGHKKNETQSEPEKTKTLVLYYSQTGATKSVADEIQRQLGADIDSIVPVDSYGYDYDATIQRWIKEKEDSVKVAIKPVNLKVNDYDTIFLGFPIWGGTYASPVETWLDDNKLEDKTIITFATFGSGGLESGTPSVVTKQPASNVVEGYGVRNARIGKAKDEINRWLIEKGYKKGEIPPLPEYGQVSPVTPEETEIFNQACGDYRFPLGTPVSVSSRTYDGVTDYRFNVKSQTPDGKVANSVIYVTVAPNEKPEFTKVVR